MRDLVVAVRIDEHVSEKAHEGRDPHHPAHVATRCQWWSVRRTVRPCCSCVGTLPQRSKPRGSGEEPGAHQRATPIAAGMMSV